MTTDHSFLTKNSCCQRHKLFHVNLAGGQQSSDDAPTFSSELITIGGSDFFDETMCPQTSQSSRESGALSALFGGVGGRSVKRRPEVSIAETADYPFPPINDLEQRCVGIRPGVKPPVTSPVFVDRTAYGFGKIGQAASCAHTGQGLQVTPIDGF